MKLTKMRIDGKKLNDDSIFEVEKDLRTRLYNAGFITEVNIETRTCIKIGLRMKSFVLDLSKHDQNLYVSPCRKMLTNLPTWKQRVKFNNIVNDCLDSHKVSANVKSGAYTIRKGLESMTENDWYEQKLDWILSNEARGFEVIKVDITEFKEARRLARNAKAKARRDEYKQTKEYKDKQFNKKANKFINQGVTKWIKTLKP